MVVTEGYNEQQKWKKEDLFGLRVGGVVLGHPSYSPNSGYKENLALRHCPRCVVGLGQMTATKPRRDESNDADQVAKWNVDNADDKKLGDHPRGRV